MKTVGIQKQVALINREIGILDKLIAVSEDENNKLGLQIRRRTWISIRRSLAELVIRREKAGDVVIPDPELWAPSDSEAVF